MKILITLAACAAIVMSGCQTNVGNDKNTEFSMSGISDKKVKKELEVEYFTELYITGAPDIIFNQTSGGKPRVCIEGSKSYVERVYAQNRGKALIIGLKDSRGINIRNNGDAKIYLYAPDLTELNITGSGDFKATHGIDTDNLKINVTGSGDMELASLICDDTDIRITGSGDMDVKNATCNNADIRVTGSGDVKFDKLTARQSAKIVTTGSGDVDIRFENSGDVVCRATGCSDITLKGNVKSMDKKCSGTGDVHTRGLRVGK